MVFGSGLPTDSETALGHCLAKSSAAMVKWAAEVPIKNAEIRHVVHCRILEIEYCFSQRKDRDHGLITSCNISDNYGEHNN